MPPKAGNRGNSRLECGQLSYGGAHAEAQVAPGLVPSAGSGQVYGSYLYDRIVPPDHLLRKINQVVDFSFANDLVRDRYTPGFGRPAEDPEFMLRLCLLQYLYGDSDRQVIENARVNLAYKYFLGLAVDEDVPDDTTVSYFRAAYRCESRRAGTDDQVASPF